MPSSYSGRGLFCGDSVKDPIVEQYQELAADVGYRVAYEQVYGEIDLRETAKMLHAAGISKQVIGDILGYSRSSVARWTDPEQRHREYQREWQRKHRAALKSGEKKKSNRSIRKEAEQRTQ